MKDIDSRLKGILKGKAAAKGLALSVEGHVNHLIKVIVAGRVELVAFVVLSALVRCSLCTVSRVSPTDKPLIYVTSKLADLIIFSSFAGVNR